METVKESRACQSGSHYWGYYIRTLSPGTVFCLLLRVSSDYAQPITGQVTELTCPVIG